jgi:hypothetical protein
VGIEPSSMRIDQRQLAAICTLGNSADAPLSASKCAMRGVVDDSADDSGKHGRLPPDALVGVVETALARALMLAAEAGRWEIVAQLAEELAARGRGRENSAPGDPNSGSLATRRRAR